jgi:DNA replication protein DnaC
MEIVEDRYGSGSTLMTSQLPTDKWHNVIGEPTFADAILYRLIQNAYRLALDGPSMRKLKAGEEKAPVLDETAATNAAPTEPAKGVRK